MHNRRRRLAMASGSCRRLTLLLGVISLTTLVRGDPIQKKPNQAAKPAGASAKAAGGGGGSLNGQGTSSVSVLDGLFSKYDATSFPTGAALPVEVNVNLEIVELSNIDFVSTMPLSILYFNTPASPLHCHMSCFESDTLFQTATRILTLFKCAVGVE
jgi:hypothetical protein